VQCNLGKFNSELHVTGVDLMFVCALWQGLYEILSMSGCYNLMNEGQSDGLSVTLCSPERHIIGGVLGGALVAASTVQVTNPMF
jgi:hypothetical protein